MTTTASHEHVTRTHKRMASTASPSALYMSIYMCTHKHNTHAHMCVTVCGCIYRYTFAHMRAHARTNTHTLVRVCVFVRMFECVRLRVCLRAREPCVCISTSRRTRISACTVCILDACILYAFCVCILYLFLQSRVLRPKGPATAGVAAKGVLLFFLLSPSCAFGMFAGWAVRRITHTL